MTKYLIPLLLITATACVDLDGFDPGNLTAEERAQVQLAFDEWAQYGHYAEFGAGDSSFAMVYDIPGKPANVGGLCIYSLNRTKILIKYERDVRLYALHELGHHFGCARDDQHLPVGNVMATQVITPRLTPADVACAD
jgi:hypothetical protein